ncbi:glycoside hydrolase 5 family protein [Persicobacter diffluens]|uniref:mannan endo-1,4-beta-mannosidase n=1 Tax=Persicobacter diffluens TaxID=981 RepID=A0AAN5AMJ6_9BACT|nr:endo-1,4-beta-mannosidase [Persicobacter diffluens]
MSNFFKRLVLTLLMSGTIFNLTAKGHEGFVKVKGASFEIGGEPYRYIGANFWYGMNLAAQQTGNRERLLRELDDMKSVGITNLRLMASTEGTDDPWQVKPTLFPEAGKVNQDMLEGLDFLLAEMGKRNMKAVLCLNNFWTWSGGMPQYLKWSNPDRSIPFPPPAEHGDWWKYAEFAKSFYGDARAVEIFRQHLNILLDRQNSVNGRYYKEDPTIMSWQLANEPRANAEVEAYLQWIEETAALIKEKAPRQLVSIGSEGYGPDAKAGTDALRDHALKNIDYVTTHVWIANWGWFDAENPELTFDAACEKVSAYFERHLQAAEELNKPLVLEEFGVGRDGDSYAANSSSTYRDRYYQWVFEYILNAHHNGRPFVGCNFWAWGGEGRPRTPKCVWEEGDDLIGDPPHEFQGWYSVYNTDKRTKKLIKKYNKQLK